MNAFTGEGLSPAQLGMQESLRKLLKYRKGSRAIQAGETTHFAPEDGVYLMARVLGDETVVLVINKNEGPVLLDTGRFGELGLGGEQLRNVLTGAGILWADSVSLPRRGAYVFTTRQ